MTNILLPRRPILDDAAIERAIENTLSMAAAAVEVDFNVTAKTWTHKPDFKIARARGLRRIYTEDRIYGYVNRGTRVRHAVMVPGFRPKSRKGFIGANMGRGGAVVVSRKIVRPGIEAREFDVAIADKWRDEFPDQLQRAIDTEVSRQNRANSSAAQ